MRRRKGEKELESLIEFKAFKTSMTMDKNWWLH